MKEFSSEKIIFTKMIDTLNICMKENSEKIFFDKMIDTLNICMKEFTSEKIFFDKMTAVRT